MKTGRLPAACLAAALAASLMGAGCSPKEIVRMNIDRFAQAAPESYSGKEVIISATLKDLIERKELYRNKLVEVTAPFSYYGRKRFWTWYVQLVRDDLRLRCYTHYYRIEAGWDARFMLDIAKSRGAEVTIVGTLYDDGIDIRSLSYDGQSVRPDFKPLFHDRLYRWYF